jgi:dynein intermediate chain 2, axonemal
MHTPRMKHSLAMQTPSANTVTMLHDPTTIPRSVNMVDWNSEGTKLATAYAIMDFQQQPANMSLHSYVWDLQNPNSPEFTMQPLSQVVSAKFNLKDPNIIGAGQYNGQFAYFDMRKGGTQVWHTHPRTVAATWEGSHILPGSDARSRPALG